MWFIKALSFPLAASTRRAESLTPLTLLEVVIMHLFGNYYLFDSARFAYDYVKHDWFRIGHCLFRKRCKFFRLLIAEWRK